MKKSKPKRRPGVLVRMYPQDILELNKVCADACTPRENFCRRAIMEAVRTTALLAKGAKILAHK